MRRVILVVLVAAALVMNAGASWAYLAPSGSGVGYLKSPSGSHSWGARWVSLKVVKGKVFISGVVRTGKLYPNFSVRLLHSGTPNCRKPTSTRVLPVEADRKTGRWGTSIKPIGP